MYTARARHGGFGAGRIRDEEYEAGVSLFLSFKDLLSKFSPRSFTDLRRDANQIDLRAQPAAISTACVSRIPFRHLQRHERAWCGIVLNARAIFHVCTFL